MSLRQELRSLGIQYKKGRSRSTIYLLDFKIIKVKIDCMDKLVVIKNKNKNKIDFT